MTIIDNIVLRTDSTALARRKRDSHLRISVRRSEVEERVQDGWVVDRRMKTTTRLKKEKSPAQSLEDRFWSIIYRMEFPLISGEGGALFKDQSNRMTDQIDVLAQDDEVLLLAECKHLGSKNSKLNYAEVIGRLHGLREPAAKALQGKTENRIKVAPCLVVSGGKPHDLAYQRSVQLGVPILAEADIEYYESLVEHLGPAARYQFMADLLPGKEVEGLTIEAPAIRGRMGDSVFYTFSVHPADLLKTAYVSHRMRGQGSDASSYQRMVRRKRLDAIRRYISDGGVFPTNIVVNLHEKPRFDLASQASRLGEARMGKLTLQPKYKSAWIIDGQHRLFAYSGHEYAARDYLTVVAFEQLDAPTQARLFVDINGEQKSVSRSLLNELFYELHWNSTDPNVRTKAVISKAVQGLGTDSGDSPFFGRIQNAEGGSDPVKCLTIASMFSALEKSGLFFERKSGSNNLAFGPFWYEADNTRMVKRVCAVLNSWFGLISAAAQEWWDLGKGDGGGLAMNDSVAANIDVLRSVFEHLRDNEGFQWLDATDAQLCAAISPFAGAVG